VEILQPGYRIGDRILRPARVAVAEPEPNAPAPVADPVAVETAEPMTPEAAEESSSGRGDESVEAAGESGKDESATTDQA
jgi:molecular chaperone GrpE